MKWIFFCALAFVITSSAGVGAGGEFSWLLLVAAICIGLARMMNGYWRVIPAIVGGAVLFFHAAGYKFFGSVTICNNEPLNAPQELAALVAPNVLVMKNGAHYELRGVTFHPEYVPTMDYLRELIRQSASQPILVQPDPNAPSGVVAKARILYGCGNTFFPYFNPRRLPRYGKADLGLLLLQQGACERAPSNEGLSEEERYRSPWMEDRGF